MGKIDKKTIVPRVETVDDIRLAFVGKVPEDDHPYSWSAIVNGYDSDLLEECPNTVIREYLVREPRKNFGIPGVRVTHIWCDHREDARRIARVSRIPCVATSAEDVIGQVDAVVIPTDIGEEHLNRARPFVEAGLPVLIDKPLTVNAEDLQQFVRWHEEGKQLMSSSCMRFAREFAFSRTQLHNVGQLRLLMATTCRSWERYGIHALEALYPLLPSGGWKDIRMSGTREATIAHLRHEVQSDVVVAAIADIDGAFGCVSLYGTRGAVNAQFHNSFFAFKAQLMSFVEYLRSGISPYPFSETVELMNIVIAGIRSQAEGGRTIVLAKS